MLAACLTWKLEDWSYTVTLPLRGHHCSYSWHQWASPHVIFSNSLFVVICLFSSCSPSVACVISSPSSVISQGFLIVHSWLDHKVSSASVFSFTLFRFSTIDHTFHSNFFTVSSCIFPSQFLFLLLHCFSVSSQKQTKPSPIPRGEGREGRDRISLKMW